MVPEFSVFLWDFLLIVAVLGAVFMVTVNSRDTSSWKFNNSWSQSPNEEILSMLEWWELDENFDTVTDFRTL